MESKLNQKITINLLRLSVSNIYLILSFNHFLSSLPPSETDTFQVCKINLKYNINITKNNIQTKLHANDGSEVVQRVDDLLCRRNNRQRQ